MNVFREYDENQKYVLKAIVRAGWFQFDWFDWITCIFFDFGCDLAPKNQMERNGSIGYRH